MNWNETAESSNADDLPRGGLRQDVASAGSTNPLDQLEGGQLEALSRFRDGAGRRWKSRLLAGWIRAAYPGHLQAIRNQLGPEWLATVKDDHFRLLEMRVDAERDHQKDRAYTPGPRM
ncbi:hypothetical protein A2G96_13215 [Cupriavidus nantongensis]|uniref:Uncharacterized protein n=1 Tax=Cupriavidus nantongensis TaxID=1796606 RepID=A0A142JKL3_9BURK|nr:hypothetical protein A2G96_13215 [Cupriavidus nantongensis]